MRLLHYATVLAACVVLAGCSGTVSDEKVDVEQQETPVKKMLEDVAKSGELGSSAMEIREGLEALKADGNSKAAGLLSDLDDLEAMGKRTSAVKKKAAEMAAKL
jgi:hypothetical protein